MRQTGYKIGSTRLRIRKKITRLCSSVKGGNASWQVRPISTISLHVTSCFAKHQMLVPAATITITTKNNYYTLRAMSSTSTSTTSLRNNSANSPSIFHHNHHLLLRHLLYIFASTAPILTNAANLTTIHNQLHTMPAALCSPFPSQSPDSLKNSPSENYLNNSKIVLIAQKI